MIWLLRITSYNVCYTKLLRLMNVIGDSIDGMKALDKTGAYPIHT